MHFMLKRILNIEFKRESKFNFVKLYNRIGGGIVRAHSLNEYILRMEAC